MLSIFVKIDLFYDLIADLCIFKNVPVLNALRLKTIVIVTKRLKSRSKIMLQCALKYIILYE